MVVVWIGLSLMENRISSCKNYSCINYYKKNNQLFLL